MRRSSRIQIKQEITSASKCDPTFTHNKRVPLQAVENRPRLRTTGSRIPKRKDSKKRRTPAEGKEEPGAEEVGHKDSSEGLADNIIADAANHATTSSNQKTAVAADHPLLSLEESNDSALTDVAHTIKIDRTIKNLSPKKFFINKDGKTTRSGRSFSPYDFATYSLLFGNLSASNNAKTDRRDVCPVKNIQNQDKRLNQNRESRIKRRNRNNSERKRSKKVKKHRSKQYRRRKKGNITASEIPTESVSILRSPLVTMKIEKPDLNEDLCTEAVPTAFLFDFLPTPEPELEGHSLPRDFYSPYVPVAVDDAEALSPMFSTPVRKFDQSELDALSKISLFDAEKYEFKSVFKDVHAQVASFESSSGHEVLSNDICKFDLMESESVEGRRFYRKRITDSRLIAWHKYNLMSSTRYTGDADPPSYTRPIIKVRSNQCPKADLVWRLNQTLPPPSIEDVLDLSKEEAVASTSKTTVPSEAGSSRSVPTGAGGRTPCGGSTTPSHPAP